MAFCRENFTFYPLPFTFTFNFTYLFVSYPVDKQIEPVSDSVFTVLQRSDEDALCGNDDRII